MSKAKNTRTFIVTGGLRLHLTQIDNNFATLTVVNLTDERVQYPVGFNVRDITNGTQAGMFADTYILAWLSTYEISVGPAVCALIHNQRQHAVFKVKINDTDLFQYEEVMAIEGPENAEDILAISEAVSKIILK